MAPAPPTFKTYSRRHIPHRRNSSVDVFDALLAENICKRKEAAQPNPRRRKKAIKIKELPPLDENHHLIEDSICRSWGLNDTFDRLRKEPGYTCTKPVFMTASNSSTSNSKILLTNSVHSPIIHNTRGYKKRLDSSNELSQCIVKTNKKEKTLDRSVNDSLVVEKVPIFTKPKEVSLLSSTSNLMSDGSVPPQMRSVTNYNDADISSEPVFSKTFRETVGVRIGPVASTPAVASRTPCKSIPMINDTISPILNNAQPKSLIESYEEIQKWNFKPPDFVSDGLCGNDTPKVTRTKQLQPRKLQKKKEIVKNKIVNGKVISAVFAQKKFPQNVYRAKPDWKLKGEAKVVLDKCLDVIGIEKSVTIGNLNETTLGFLADQGDVLKKCLATRSIFEESFKKLCAQNNVKAEDAPATPLRYIVLRKRKVPVVSTKTKPKTEKTDLGLITHRENKSSTNSQASDKNYKSIHSKQHKQRNSNESSSSVSQQEFDINSQLKCSQSVDSKSSSFETSANQKSILSDAQESIRNSVNEIDDTSAIDLQDSSINLELGDKIAAEVSTPVLGSLKIPRKLCQYGKVVESLSSSNNETSNLSKQIENVAEASINELSAFNDFNRRGSISLQSHIELEVVNSNELENGEESPVLVSNEMTSPDVIPSTPPTKIMFSRAKYKKTLLESLIDIATDGSKTVECSQSQTQSVTNASDENVRCNTANDFTKDTNYHDSVMEGSSVDISASKTEIRGKNDDDSSSCNMSGSTVSVSSESGLCDGVDQNKVEESIFEESEAKLNKSLEKYSKQECSYFDNDNSILEHHNYSKVFKYFDNTEVIEVISSDEEDTNENMQSNRTTSPKSKASCISNKPSCEIESSLLECKNSSNSHNNRQNDDLPIDLDEELDFSEFIASYNESALKVIHKEVIDDTIDPSAQSTDIKLTTIAEEPKTEFKTPPILFLKPGKLWKRSLLTVRKSSIICDPIVCKADRGCICTCAKCRQKNSSTPSRSSRRMSIKIIPESPYRSIQKGSSVLEKYASFNITYGSNTIQDSVYRERSIGEPLLVRNSSIHESLPLPVINPTVTARDIVLRRCGQAEPISFTGCYPSSVLKNCFKIGEGVYGEVFLFKNSDGGSRVMKVIPIEGAQMVNGEHQKKFEEILSEIVVAMELSNLRNDKKNKTDGFSKVEKIRCVQGRYPDRLLELWELFDETRGSENDSPEMFTDDQLYIVLELANGGQDMEAFVFNNASQAFTLFKQTACALAVAESALQFEHRDLHWGNILISQTDKNKKLIYCLNGQEFEIPACGVEVSIIDFTLSRITYDGVCIFNDLSADPDLFASTGDYQFEIYKLMQKRNNNKWQHFEPYSNVLWLHYVLDKMASALRYKYTTTIVHKEGIAKIKQLKNRILKYSSVKDMVNNEFIS